ncbi:MAG: nuclear transport factor 2 family protein, partial [Gammaproteobacteria bacterium]
YVDDTVSGHSMIDGPSEITDLDSTSKNKNIVNEFLAEVLGGGDPEKISDYVSTERYTQHSPKIADGVAGMVAFLHAQAKSGSPLRYEEIFKVIGQGNLVASLSKVSLGDKSLAVFDLFRLANGKIVEHWDAIEVIAPKERWANSGKF